MQTFIISEKSESSDLFMSKVEVLNTDIASVKIWIDSQCKALLYLSLGVGRKIILFSEDITWNFHI